MGMFDSFKFKGNEVQTKQLECNLDVFEIGDNVPTNYNGSKNFYILEDDYPINAWYGFIIVGGIFLDCIEFGEKPEETSQQNWLSDCNDRCLELLNVYVKNDKLTSLKLFEILYDKNQQLEECWKTYWKIRRLVYDYKEFINGDVNEHTKFLYRHVEDFENGTTLEELLYPLLDLNTKD